ncbi:MAG TPA: GtrA family protein [Methylophilus sp.]|nr:GtrA family protein [Methylophilus sp.]
MRASVLGFVSVGAVAAAVHYVVALLAHALGLSPSDANWLGFLAAFPVSYIGHRRWSFRGTQAGHQQAFPKFLAVALLGFMGNQALVWLALTYTPLPFWFVLGVVMVIIAVSTWLLSRFWAFKHA